MPDSWKLFVFYIEWFMQPVDSIQVVPGKLAFSLVASGHLTKLTNNVLTTAAGQL